MVDIKDYTLYTVKTSRNEIMYNGEVMDWSQVQHAIRKSCSDPAYLFIFETDDDCSHGDNARLYCTVFSAINDLRDHLSRKRYGIPFENLLDEQSDEITKLFPVRIMQK